MSASSVLITGTTSGIGRALLEHYVASGARIISVNRRRVPELERRYPSVHFQCLDVRSTHEVESFIGGLTELPEIFILNAGINLADNDESFQLEAFKSAMDTNLYGVLNFVQPITRRPRSEVPRHVVAISSMASYVGNPYALGYHTSKKALTACFDAWSRMYTGTDLIFQQVLLGPVATNIHTMSDRFPRWMVRIRDLFSASLEGTARAISRFALTRKKKLFYPGRVIPLYLGMWLCRAVVPGVFQGRRTLAGNTRRAAPTGPERGAAIDELK
jgi:NAD(P)-dependent dehydrogenase (short-subunit alcohol dehydrogenase family)